MPKLDVGVGDEFPAKEVKNEPPEEEPMVHHHHYYRGRDRYYRYRYRGRWLWFVLWIMVISAVFRMFDMMAGATGWAASQWGGPWAGFGSWMWGPFHALQGTLMAILFIGGWIVISRWRPHDDEPDEGPR